MLPKITNTRGSRYKNKIDPVVFHIAYEGAVAEKEYFEALSKLVPKRFRNNVKLIPVPKSSTNSAPSKVLADLTKHLKDNSINLKRSTSNVAFIVIDTDHHFTGTHSRSTYDVVNYCKNNNISVVITKPCFEVWLMCHYIDICTMTTNFQQDLLDNIKVSGNNRFAKVEFGKLKGRDTHKDLMSKLSIAITNESKISSLSTHTSLPPTSLYSNVGDIIKNLNDTGIGIL